MSAWVRLAKLEQAGGVGGWIETPLPKEAEQALKQHHLSGHGIEGAKAIVSMTFSRAPPAHFRFRFSVLKTEA